jgi:hypothetical protein
MYSKLKEKILYAFCFKRLDSSDTTTTSQGYIMESHSFKMLISPKPQLLLLPHIFSFLRLLHQKKRWLLNIYTQWFRAQCIHQRKNRQPANNFGLKVRPGLKRK